MKNVTFSGYRQAAGEAVIMAPQDCGLKKIRERNGMATLCNVDYYFEDVDFSGVPNNGGWVGFSAVVGNPTATVYTSQDDSLVGHQFIISNLYDGFEKVDGCSQSDDTRFKGAIACDKEEVKIGRLILWTSSSTNVIKLSGPGYDAEPNYDNITLTNQIINLKGLNAGYINYDYPEILEMLTDGLKYQGGYGAHVILGETYQIEDIGDTEVFFKLYDLYPGDEMLTTEIELNLCLNGTCEPCSLTKDNRKWFADQGVGEQAEQNECGKVYNNLRVPATSAV